MAAESLLDSVPVAAALPVSALLALVDVAPEVDAPLEESVAAVSLPVDAVDVLVSLPSFGEQALTAITADERIDCTVEGGMGQCGQRS